MMRWMVLGLLVVAGCGDDSVQACVTRADCRDDQVCINGGCSLIGTDAAPTDAEPADADTDTEVPDAETLDAEMPDAATPDASSDCRVVDCPESLMCDPASGSCVQCLLPTDCASGMCSDGVCAACASASECAAPEAAACNVTTGACEPCTSDPDCAGTIEGGASAVCDAGLCVECTEANNGACGGRSCDPATNRCTTTPTDSLDQCQACVSDTECIGGACIPMLFRGEPHGSYCLRRGGCDRGFRELIERISVSGAPLDQYCGINEDETTCEAVLSIGRPCDTPTDCELGGSCERFGGPFACTIPCNGSRDCPEDGAPGSCDLGFCRTR